MGKRESIVRLIAHIRNREVKISVNNYVRRSPNAKVVNQAVSANKRASGDGKTTTPWMPKKMRKHLSLQRGVAAAREIMKKPDLHQQEKQQQDNSSNSKTELFRNIRVRISELGKGAVRKKTTVGVFGETGAGKSSLMNAVLGEKDLLPSGTLYACTSVIIQVEANITDSNYTAEIELISNKNWKKEVTALEEDGEESDDELCSTASENITALYRKEGVKMKDEYFCNNPEFFGSKTKNIKSKRAPVLKKMMMKCYVQDVCSSPGRCYWPIVSVTIKVPNCEYFLENIVLVDLPGIRDHNKGRDHMWKLRKNRSSLHENFKINLNDALQLLKAYSDKICICLEELLSKGAKESEEKCTADAKKLIQPRKDCRGFHQTLTALCKNDGSYRSKNGEIDLNAYLAKHMLQHIDEAFHDLFPFQENVTEKSSQANIDKCTLIPEDMSTANENSQALKYMLQFLRTEEMELKTTLKQEIVERKRRIYASLSESIKATMLPCYQRAAGICGSGSMKKKQEMLLNHIESKKSEMFQKAKTEMLYELRKMLDYIVERIRTELTKPMEYSLSAANTLSNMDVSKELEEMEALKRSVKD